MRGPQAVLSAALLLLCLAFRPEAWAEQTAVSASPWLQAHASRVRLVAGQARTANGQYLAGLEIGLDDGWKTYWRMPGDSGVPPSFDWKGSVNVAAINVLYPAPTRMAEAAGEAIGYKHAVLLPIEVTPEDPARPVRLKLELEIGICREICVPVTAKLDLAIPVGSQGAAPQEIAMALERVPRQQHNRRKSDPAPKRIAIDNGGPSPKLVIEAAFAGDGKGADVFVEAPEGLYVPLPKRVTNDGGTIRFETNLGQDLAKDLKGKTLTLTFVSEAGASEVPWPAP